MRTYDRTEVSKMEELVNKIAELQAELKEYEEKAAAEVAAAKIDEEIAYHEKQIAHQRSVREILIRPYIEAAEELKTTIGDLYATIIDEWTGEKKTMVFGTGTLKFRQTESLKIIDETLVLTGLLDHTTVGDVATNYITGFNKTAVKKYMGVLELPMGAAEIEYKTTVKLEV